MRTNRENKFWLAMFGASLLVSSTAWSADSQSKGTTSATDNGAEEVKIEQIKQKYWAGGDEAQVGVVQNRTYSKAHKWSFGIGGGVAFDDPFLSTKIVDINLGYHFTEYFGVELMYWKIWDSGSSAYTALQESGKDANLNREHAYYGADVMWSFMYGKLSFMSEKIIYYDMHLTAGAGMVTTDSGNDPAGTVGLGQRFFLGKSTSLRLDYRLMVYHEDILEHVLPRPPGTIAGERMNWGHTIVIGIDFMFGGGSSGGAKK